MPPAGRATCRTTMPRRRSSPATTATAAPSRSTAPRSRPRIGSDAYHGGAPRPRGGASAPARLRARAGARGRRGRRPDPRGEPRHRRASGDRGRAPRRGAVRARHVILAGNGYLGGLVPEVAARVMPINNFIVATAPLGEARARALIPTASRGRRLALRRQLLAALRRPPAAVRRRRELRLALPGRHRRAGAAADARGLSRASPTSPIDHAWGGTLAITVNRMPAFQRLGPDVFSAGGYSGHGVALATLAGKLMAEAVQGTAGRFDVFAALPQPRFPGGARAAPAAAGAGDDLVRAAGPALMELWVGLSLARGLPAEPAVGAAEGADAAASAARGDLCPLPLRRAAGGARLVAVLALRPGDRAADRRRRSSPGRSPARWRRSPRRCCCSGSSPCGTSRSATPSPRPRPCRRRCWALVLLGDRIGRCRLRGILVSLVGIVLLSAGGWRRRAFDRAAALGLACGAAFALVGGRLPGAALALDGDAGRFCRGRPSRSPASRWRRALILGLWMRLAAPGATVAATPRRLAAWRRRSGPRGCSPRSAGSPPSPWPRRRR